MRNQGSKVVRLAGHSFMREYGVFSKVTKKSQEAIEKAKDAAKSVEGVNIVTEQIKQQAAKATSTLSDTMAQAQGLAKETVNEMFNKGAGSTSNNSNTESAKTQQQQTEENKESTSSSEQEQASASSSFSSSSRAGVVERFRGFAASAVQEMKQAILPEQPATSAIRGAAAKAADFQAATTTELAISKDHQQEETSWQRQWRETREKLGSHPIFKTVHGTLKDNIVMNKGRDVAENIREKWETSDSAFVHRIQDATDSLFAEGEQAQALREIRSRDTSFDMVDFLKHIKHDVPILIKAYLEGNEQVIKEYCSAEMIERLLGIAKAQAAAGLTTDPTLLDVSEVELVDLKMFEDQPVVVVQFTCQQINCTRDSFGNVVEGGPDEVHRVYYYWALQQEAQGFVGEDGAYHPPRWQLREMLIRGMHHLL